MTLRSRINRLATHRIIRSNRPAVTCVFLRRVHAVDSQTGEVTSADIHCSMVWTSDGWRTITREDGEIEAAFIERTERMEKQSYFSPCSPNKSLF